jgi:WD40 repeat protein
MASGRPPPCPVTVLRGHKEAVNCVAFLSEDCLSSGALDGQVKVWDLTSRRAQASWDAHRGHSVLSVCSMSTRKSVVSCGRDGYVRIWDVTQLANNNSTDTALSSLQTGSRHFCNACGDSSQIDPDTVVTPSSEESDVLIWDLRTGKREAAIKGNEGRGMLSSLVLRSIAVGNEADINLGAHDADAGGGLVEYNAMLVAGYEDGSICCYDLRTLKALCDIKVHSEPVMALDMSPDGRRVSCGGASRQIVRCRFRQASATTASTSASPSPSTSTATTASLEQLETHELPVEGTACLRYRCDGRIFASAQWDGTIRIFDAKVKPLAVLRHHRQSACGVDFSPHGGLLATASKDATVAVWDVFADTVK